MAVTFTFADLWMIPLFALIVQAFTSVFLFRVYGKIGNSLGNIFIGFQVLGYVYIGMILYRFIDFSELTPEFDYMDIFRIFFGFVFPVSNAWLHFKLQRFYKHGLEPNKVRDMKRDTARDTVRDVERDLNRDRERDVRRDLYKDRDS